MHLQLSRTFQISCKDGLSGANDGDDGDVNRVSGGIRDKPHMTSAKCSDFCPPIPSLSTKSILLLCKFEIFLDTSPPFDVDVISGWSLSVSFGGGRRPGRAVVHVLLLLGQRRSAVLAARPDRERAGLVGRPVEGREVRLLPGLPPRRAAQDRVQVRLIAVVNVQLCKQLFKDQDCNQRAMTL